MLASSWKINLSEPLRFPRGASTGFLRALRVETPGGATRSETSSREKPGQGLPVAVTGLERPADQLCQYPLPVFTTGSLWQRRDGNHERLPDDRRRMPLMATIQPSQSPFPGNPLNSIHQSQPR